ncbi:MAG: NUDIX hydrolase [Candidatus Thorarchaeota archaeon]
MHRNPALTVDVVVIEGNKILLVKRGQSPHQGEWALPGGFVEYGETSEAAAKREVQEETGIAIELSAIMGVYSDPDRDPRGHTVSVVFIGEMVSGQLQGGDDAADAKWYDINDLHEVQLAFDHGMIVQDLRHWLKNRSTFWSTMDRD